MDIPLESRKKADVMCTLPEDSGPKGEVLKLLLKLWISFEPNPFFGDGFERGKTVSVSQAVRCLIECLSDPRRRCHARRRAAAICVP